MSPLQPLIEYLMLRHPSMVLSLADGARDEYIEETERRMGLKFDHGTRSVYRNHDGHRPTNVFHPGILCEFRFASLSEMLEAWRLNEELRSAGEDVEDPEAHAAVKGVYGIHA